MSTARRLAPPGIGRGNRWPHRLAGLGPFTLVNAAATVDEARKNISLTIVNRGETEDALEVSLRDFVFDGDAALQTLTTATVPSVQPRAGSRVRGTRKNPRERDRALPTYHGPAEIVRGNPVTGPRPHEIRR